MFYNIYVNSLLKKLKEEENPQVTVGTNQTVRGQDNLSKINLNHLSFVDDIMIFAEGENCPQVKKKLDKLIPVCTEW